MILRVPGAMQYVTLLRRTRTIPNSGYGTAPDQQRTAYALRSIRGTGSGSSPARDDICQFPNPCAITLRMTLGSASSFNVAIGTKRMPDGARVPAGTRAV